MVPFALCLALALAYTSPKRNFMVWTLSLGVILSLCLALPVPALSLPPRYGVTVSLFFLCLLCAVTSLPTVKVTYTVDCA